jgi:hypothetical protein
MGMVKLKTPYFFTPPTVQFFQHTVLVHAICMMMLLAN